MSLEEWVRQEAYRLVEDWRVALDIASRVAVMQVLFAYYSGGTFPVVISGYRTEAEQATLIRQGRGAPDHLSTHRSWPATGLDLSIGRTPTYAEKALFGGLAQAVGLRWGGGSALDENGQPWDWNHVDGGPRQ